MTIFAESVWFDGLLVVTGAAGAVLVINLLERGQVRAARAEREKILDEARRDVESLRDQAQLAATQEAEQFREGVEKRLEAKESAILDRESILNRQLDKVTNREQALDQVQDRLDTKQQNLDASEVRLKALETGWRTKLEDLARFSEAEARQVVLDRVERESRREAQDLARRIVAKAKQASEEEARRIIGLAIQRYAGDHTSETTTASVLLKGDDIKGRIIGREGRNIRAFENATGMTVLIDDTPNAVVLSGFDPVRREIARESMERLIADGRIHPTRIEEVVERVTSEIESRILKVAEEAVARLGLAPMHEEIARRLGRLYFRLSYSQNVLDHSIEVARLTALMAGELGANVTDATRAGLLHDVGKALGDEVAGSHALAGAEFIRRHGENEIVANAVAAHHDEVEHESVLGMLVSAADAISAARPGARSEPITAYINRLKNLEEIGVSLPGVERCFAVQAGREVRVFVRPEEVDDERAQSIAREICRTIEETLQYPGQIRVTVIRETRCVDYAK